MYTMRSPRASATAWPIRRTLRHALRRFPPPWSVEELEACFIVKDRPKAGFYLFRGRAGATISGQTAHERRGATDCCEHRETAGAIGPPVTWFGFQILQPFEF